jgi:DNA-binding SARP family transcriptional activator
MIVRNPSVLGGQVQRRDAKRRSDMEIRLLGGFEVRADGPGEARFESQKVRALLAYLAAQSGRSFSRDHLAALLWPEGEADAARQSLRQALYNLRQTLPECDEVLTVDHTTVGLRLRDGDRVDVMEFLAAYRQGLPGGEETAVRPLLHAAELYRGELMAGFFVRDSAAFEEWLVTEQERLREAALHTLRTLVQHYAARGEYDTAMVHARRLIEIDPLSEEAHRELMRLFVLAGRRRRALTQFEELGELLARELGVEPLPETKALYQKILTEELPEPDAAPAPPRPPLGPFVPLVGRSHSLEALSESWQRAIEEGSRLALVEGPSGIGKTRLIKSFLDRISSQRHAAVLQGRCLGEEPRSAGEPFAEMLRGLDWLQADRDSASAPPAAESLRGEGSLAERVVARLAQFAAAGDGETRQPLVLFLDDLHWAGASAWEVLPALLDGVGARPVWIVASVERIPAGELHRRLAEGGQTDVVRLDPLTPAQVQEVAADLVGDGLGAETLTEHLTAGAAGLPLAVVERINSLCDQGLLAPASRRRWNLTGEPGPALAVATDLDELIAHRIRHLPTSARRLLILAGVIGHTFDVELLQRAAQEHMGVVEIGLELMLERWLVRQYARRWSDSPRERDLVLWAQGARRGTFEFAHDRIRQVALREVNPLRRRTLHCHVAEALADRHPVGSENGVERVAHHFLEADEPAAALPYVRSSAAKALRVGDQAVAAAWLDRGRTLLERLTAREAPGREEWEREGRALEELAGAHAG